MKIPQTDTTADEPAKRRARDRVGWLAHHERWLRTVVLARTGESQAVDEVLQEVAMAVVRHPSPPSDAERLAPWLYRIAVRQSLLHRRKLGRQRRLRAAVAQQWGDGEQTASDADPLQWLIADERRQMIRHALAQLARRDAEILLLKYTENWSYRELAEHLGVTSSAIESRLTRARERLRCQLASLQVIETTS
ncbi:MAG: RNA polymerase sigma factor [Planctomycetales bacterium]|nr:RNA polymerase sigma factor [Planctomycetales bacterium]